MSGSSFPVGLCTLLVNHHGILEPSDLVLEACFLLKAPFRGMLLTLRGGPKSLAPRAHRIPVYPMVFSTFLYRAFTAHFHLDRRLVHAPAHPHRALTPMKRLFQQGTVFHDPALDGRVVDRHSTLLQEFFDMPIASGIRHRPAHAHEHDVWGEMGPLEANRHRRSPSLRPGSSQREIILQMRPK